MKLRDLQARFLTLLDRGSFREVDQGPEGAQGVMFLCPLCYAKNGGPNGTHSVICWFVGVPDDVSPGPGRWTPQGTGLDDLTFVPGNPTRAVSVALRGGCAWHGFVKNGDAT